MPSPTGARAEGTTWPRVVVVTARARLVGQAGVSLGAWPDLLLEQISGALDGGADLIQVREPDLDAGALVRFLRRLFRELPDCSSRVVVNDRVDIAWVTGAGGVHLTDRSIDLEDVRQLVSADKKWVMGRSVHDPATAARSRSASYLLAGTVQASGSKPPDWRLLGWAGLRAVVGAAEGTPVVAIGGLGAADVAAVLGAGAAGIAGIGCFLPQPGREVASSVQERVRAVRKAFDTTGGETYTRRAGQ